MKPGRHQRHGPKQAQRWRRGILLYGAVLWLGGAAPTVFGNGDSELQQRLASVAAQRQDSLPYRETRSSELFSDPVEFLGRLEFDPTSGQLTKWVDSPEPARMTLDREQLELQAGDGRTRRISLRRRPELAAMVQGLQALLRGDIDLMQSRFDSQYSVREDDCWTLTLTPLEARVARRVDTIEMRGQGARLLQLSTYLTDGDTQTLHLIYPDSELPDDAPDP